MSDHDNDADDSLRWERVATQSGPDLILFKTRFDEMRNPRNQRVMRRLVLESVDWVNMVARTTDGRLVMVEQFRFGIGNTTIETPGGMVDSGEDSLAAAQRELLEETGFGGGAWSYLGSVEPNPAIHPHLCHHWLAEGVHRVAEPRPGQGEAIAVHVMSESAMRDAIDSGRLRHALALSALARVYTLWPARPAASE
ncbi:MAG: NUDIX hydrolase [Gammaproteobacteria bacterium]|nr:MAG: NUDIX hydrolase [Gammaproteobacteria bacterium]